MKSFVLIFILMAKMSTLERLMNKAIFHFFPQKMIHSKVIMFALMIKNYATSKFEKYGDLVGCILKWSID